MNKKVKIKIKFGYLTTLKPLNIGKKNFNNFKTVLLEANNIILY